MDPSAGKRSLDAPDVREHLCRVTHQAYPTRRIVDPPYRHFAHGVPQLQCNEDDLDIECEAIDMCALEYRLRNLSPKQLEATLGISERDLEKGSEQDIKQSSHRFAQTILTNQDLGSWQSP